MQDLKLAIQRMQDLVDGIAADVKECRKILAGTPEKPASGMVVRLDRLEQSEKRRSKLTWSAAGAAVVATIAAVSRHFGL